MGFNACSVASPNTRHAFTLLEVLLAIAISVLVMAIVGTAMFFQLQVVDSSRAEVEKAQLARALMQNIADDLRNVVRYEPQDVSSLALGGLTQDAAAAAAGAANATGGTGGTGSTSGGGASTSGGSGSKTSAGGSGAGGTGGGGTSGGSGSKTSGGGTSGGGASGGGSSSSSQGTTGSSSSSSSDSGTTTPSSDDGSSDMEAVQKTPGLRGWPDYLQVDISRLPRRDQLLSPTADAAGVLGRISDVKTVSYYVEDPRSAADGQGGLKRFEVARAESLLSMETGTLATQEQTQAKLLAAEVVAIRFQYSDGSQWYDIWPPEAATDQKSAAKLPMAVHVVLTFRPENSEEFDVASLSALDLAGLPQRRLIVHLPSAVPPGEEQDTSSPSGTQPDSSSSSSSGTSGQSSSGTQGTGAKQ
jgi:prepilin-type N-terminal cleavage/methylation domain-containing protein